MNPAERRYIMGHPRSAAICVICGFRSYWLASDRACAAPVVSKRYCRLEGQRSSRYPVPTEAGAPPMGAARGLWRLAVLIVGLLLVATSPAFAGWYSGSWLYRQKLTVNHTQVPNTNQANFAVYVNLANMQTGFFSH